MTEGKINLPRSVVDPSYRYKVTLLKTQVIGKGINIRTVLLNLKELAADIYLEPEYVLKFL